MVGEKQEIDRFWEGFIRFYSSERSGPKLRKREGREKEEERTKLKRGLFPGEKHTRTIASLCTSL